MKRKACLLIHGFTGNPGDVQPLAQYLMQDGFDVIVPTLPGHSSIHELRTVKYQDWLQYVEQVAGELQAQYGSFYVIGFSMGGGC